MKKKKSQARRLLLTQSIIYYACEKVSLNAILMAFIQELQHRKLNYLVCLTIKLFALLLNEKRI